jgi:hypothetical protein
VTTGSLGDLAALVEAALVGREGTFEVALDEAAAVSTSLLALSSSSSDPFDVAFFERVPFTTIEHLRFNLAHRRQRPPCSRDKRRLHM